MHRYVPRSMRQLRGLLKDMPIGMLTTHIPAAKLKELWNPTVRSWFPRGRRDPEIVLVAVRVAQAEYWLVPRTRMARVVGMVKAMITGKRQEAGKHGILDLHPLFA